jgi:hypothetical protein
MGEAFHICMTIIDNVSKSTCQGGYLAGTRLPFAMMKIKDYYCLFILTSFLIPKFTTIANLELVFRLLI